MNGTTIPAQDQVFWYLQRPPGAQTLREPLEADVVVIGGGMAGLTAAQAFSEKSKKVVLLEAYYCGAGASGKSSGFITPNSELSLSDFIARYGKDGGHTIWKTVESGVEHIRRTLQKYQLRCSYRPEDTLIVANTHAALKQLRTEHEHLKKFGYQTEYLERGGLSALIGSKNYYGGVTYANSFGIDAYAYCQELKTVLTKSGVRIFEETPVLSFDEKSATTLHAKVKADYVIVCTDRFTPALNALSEQIYHAQTFLLASQVLTNKEIEQIFPNRPLMIWDTDLIYNYYRIADNRLLLGGGSLLRTYDRYERHNSGYLYKKLTDYFKAQFSQLDLQFEQMWPGLIGVSKDIAPLCGRDKDRPSIYYIAAAAGLPIAAALANYCADHMLDNRDDLKDYFSPYRDFPIAGLGQKILGKRLSFALSHLISLYF